MSGSRCESGIVSALADHAARRITRKAIADLQRMHITLSGDDSPLRTTWDEICVQKQDQESVCWDTCEETVNAILGGYVADLPAHEQQALWLQSQPGEDWNFDNPDTAPPCPVSTDDIITYLANTYIYAAADTWTNPRIRQYLDRASRRD